MRLYIVNEYLRNVVLVSLFINCVLYILITYRNEKMYMGICEMFRAVSHTTNDDYCFKYFNFNITFYYVPTKKIIYVYFPLIFKKTVSTNKSIPTEWYIFINSLPKSKKAWLYFEIFLLKMSGILMVLLVVLWMQG